MNVFVPACYIRMYVDTEADLGGGPGVRTPPPPFIPNMYETTGFMLCVIVTQYRIVLYI